MHDLKWIRENPDAFDEGLTKRGLEPQAQEILRLDETRRLAVTQLQDLQARRNAASKEIGKAKGKGGDPAKAEQLMAEVAKIKELIQSGEDDERQRDGELQSRLQSLPNLPLDDVPVGDESANKELRSWGKKPALKFEPKQHFDIGETLGLMDFEAAARMSGARFVVLKGALARLERAIGQFMLDLHTSEFGYTEVSPPLLVKEGAMFGTAQLPKFAEDLFATTNGFYLISTSEIPLTNLVREQVLAETVLPMRQTALTPCFRSEAGAAGKDTRGMVRQHQFWKVELVSITTPEQSLAELERMTSCAEEVLKRLKLPYRVIVLATGDMDFSARKTYDIEVWLPGQGTYREISSCSVCGDFQARRMQARYRPGEGKDLRFVHTLNGSGMAVGRTLIAVLENYQQADGSVIVPEALRPYMGGIERIPAGEIAPDH